METGKSRVAKVFSGQVPDRVPLDIGGIINSTMHWTFEKRLKERLGLPAKEPHIVCRDGQVVVPDDALLEYFEVDTRSICLDEERPWRDGGNGVFYDQWGIGRRFDGRYYTMCEHPLQGRTLEEALETYEWPNPYSEARLAGLVERAKAYQGKYCLIVDGFREICFGIPSWIRGMTDFYMDLAADPVMAAEFLDRLTEWHIKLVDFVLARLGPYVDIIKLSDDLGTQSSLIISPEMYREFIKPREAKVVQAAKKLGHKVLLHSCGAVRAIIGDFIEAGFDGLNPVQISAVGMEPEGLKRDFGGRIVFWGGGIDTQMVLPKGTPKEIKAEVKHNLEVFKQGGGYVFAQVHNIQPDVPVENVLAMLEAFRENRDY